MKFCRIVASDQSQRRLTDSFTDTRPSCLTNCWKINHLEVEPAAGIEPATFALRKHCSTAELRWQTLCLLGFRGSKSELYIPILHPQHGCVNPQQPESPEGIWQYAGENLRRLKTSGIYYAFGKRNGKQFSKSLKTKDKATARRLKDDYMKELDRLTTGEAAQISFEELAARWSEAERHTLKESTAARRAASVKAIAPAFSGLQIRNIAPRHCEEWAIARVKEVAARTFTKELETIRGAFRYATAQGLILRDPSANIKRPKAPQTKTPTPTREQFAAIIARIRGEAQHKGSDGADLLELIAYSGMRPHEAFSLRWCNVDFSKGVFTVTGGERGTKNHKQRTVPLSAELRGLLEKLQLARVEVSPDERIAKTESAKKCLITACRKLGLPQFTPYSFRHFFASCAVENCPDIKSIAEWMGHQDGGALLLKTYAHVRMEHSIEQMKRVSFHTIPAPAN